MEFYWTIPLDENRAIDGLELRKRYLDLHREWDEESQDLLLGQPATFFEVVIALARRIEFELYSPTSKATVGDYFWELIQNIGLSEFIDHNANPDHLWCVVTRVIDRDYEYDGTGGLFPLQHPRQDQRNVELWNQMHRYLAEQYPLHLND